MSALPVITTDILPRDAQSILELAARSMFDLFAHASEGMMLVDRQARVVWINDQYKRFLPALGFDRVEDFVGHPVASVVQNTQMHHVLESGKPILIDLLTNRAGTFVVSRIPLRDSAGVVIGALGIVLFDHAETSLQPLVGKFALLQRDLDDVRRELARQRNSPRQSKYTFASFVGTSAAAVEVKRQARRAAQTSSPVLLLGETGTGKELLAHAIHAASARASGPFISLNIAAVPDTLLEAEFFGVAPGAYTGADPKGRDGKFRLAHGGSLFLDEIGDMPLALLSAQVWRGNIRELRNVLEQATMRSDSHRILPAQLEAVLREAGVAQLPAPAPPVLPATVPRCCYARWPSRWRNWSMRPLRQPLGPPKAIRCWRQRCWASRVPCCMSASPEVSQFRQVYQPYGALTEAQWRRLTETSTRRLPDGRVTPHYDPAMVQQFTHYPDDYLLWDHYDALTLPVLCLRGADSDLVLPETLRAMASRGPGAAFAGAGGRGLRPRAGAQCAGSAGPGHGLHRDRKLSCGAASLI